VIKLSGVACALGKLPDYSFPRAITITRIGHADHSARSLDTTITVRPVPRAHIAGHRISLRAPTRYRVWLIQSRDTSISSASQREENEPSADAA